MSQSPPPPELGVRAHDYFGGADAGSSRGPDLTPTQTQGGGAGASVSTAGSYGAVGSSSERGE
jgi:hypothetical protein